MGLFSIFSKKATPGELEERSRKEKEIAQSYYQKGYRLGERMGIHDAVRRTNVFINRYPLTFFSLFTVAIVVMFVLNILLVKLNFNSGFERNMGNAAAAVVAVENDSLQMAAERMYDEYTSLQVQLEGLMARDDLTAQDSAKAIDIYHRLLELEEFFMDNRQAGIEVRQTEETQTAGKGGGDEGE
nr:hypothetical protein [Clostridia bacterium]